MAYKEYENPEELRHVQRVSTRILGELDRVCRKLDIPYVVYGGTAIGAVRHKGFIPWDDDVDVCMARPDYERFLREAPSELGEEYAIANTRTNPEFPSVYSYLTLKGTLCIPEFYKDCVYRKPLSIDVFPLDNVPDDPAAYKKQARSTWIWGRLVFLRATPSPYIAFDGWKRAIVLVACHVAHWGMRLFRVRPERLQARWERAARRYEGVQCERMADYSDRTPLKWAVTREELYPALDVPFEDITVKLPRCYDVILTRGYGSYMELPPVEQRKNHYPFLIDLGKY